MPTFTYKAMDPQFRFITGEIEAGSLREVSSELEKLGYVVLDTSTGKNTAAKPSFFSLRRPVGRREITVFLRELSLVLRAGLTLDDALLLLAGEESAGLANIVRDLRAAITAGASFGDALERYPRLFGADLVAMVRVAEATGNLDGVLELVGEERARTERLMDKVSSALRYPAVLMIVALGVLVFFLVYVVPQFASVLRDFGQSPEGFVGAVLAASDFFVAHGTTIAALLAVVLAGSSDCATVSAGAHRLATPHQSRAGPARHPGIAPHRDVLLQPEHASDQWRHAQQRAARSHRSSRRRRCRSR